ncbi:TonB-dependent receptor [Oceanicaulis sp.]|uniref:TonB-dependent receptor n=1 Tax=Oceanicaulis sp. TaxID=1924941 RepID=UPI003F6E44C6
MTTSKAFTCALLTGASILAYSMPAIAQTSETPVEDVIVVTGARLQNQRAVEQKRDADVIADFITADDVGALPDFSVAEALTRIAGVSTEDRNGDTEFVVVRGLRSDFNFLSIDGAIVPSTRNNGRATQLSVIPSYVIDVTGVQKSFSADMDGNALGGNIAVRTRSAFNTDGVYFAVRGALGGSDHTDAPGEHDLGTRGDFAFTSTFGDQDQFGLVLSGSYLNATNDTWLPGVSWSEYDFFNSNGSRVSSARIEDAEPGTIQVPHGAQTYQYTNEIERQGVFGKFEYQRPGTFYATVSGYWFEETDTEQRWDNMLYRNRRNNLPGELTASSGVVAEGRVRSQYFLQGDTNTLSSLTGQFEWTPNENHTLSGLLTQAHGERENPFYQIRFDTNTANETAFGFSYDISGQYPRLTLTNPENYLDGSRYTAVFYRPRLDINEQDAFQFKLDYGLNAESDDLGWGVQVGLSYRTDERFQDQLFDHDYRPDTARTKAFSMDQALLDYTQEFDPNLFTNVPQRFIDHDAYLGFFEETQMEWDDRKDQDNEGLSSEFTVQEDITALYMQARYAGESYVLRAGVRYEDTQVDSSGYRSLQFVRETGGYEQFLPSASAVYDVTDTLRLRAAYSRTLGRGEYDDLSVLGSQSIDDTMQTISISSGNPDLRPRLSDNFDLSVEYYMPSVDGVISVGAFSKLIDNEIFTRSTRNTVMVGDAEYLETRRQPDNANSAELSGVEIGATVNSLDWISPYLADVGFTANYARIDSSFAIEMSDGVERELSGLLYQPSNIANLALFWAPGDFEFRAAWKYRDDYLISVSSSSPTFDEHIGAQTWIDLRARYNFDNGLKLFAEARNVGDGAQDRQLSYGRTAWTRDYGRSAWVGLIYKY